MNRLFYILISSLLIFSGCKRLQLTIQSYHQPGTKQIIMQTKQRTPDFESMSARAKIIWTQSGSTNNLKANVRIRKDSVIWVSVTATFGFEVIRLVMTPDSLKLIDKINKKYYLKPISYIGDITGTPLDYHIFQSMFVGRLINDNEKTMTSLISDKEYTLKSEDSTLLIHTLIDKETFLINRITLLDIRYNRQMVMDYSEYDDFDNELISTFRQLIISGEANANATIDISKIKLNQKLRYPFKANSNYERVP